MHDFLTKPDAERREIYESAAPTLGLPAVSIEKDFWVTWTLRELFALATWAPLLTFKGGTSLSKCWKLIERFSEDIDIVIDRGHFGFGAESLSNKQLDRLKKACGDQINQSMLPELRARFASVLHGRDAAWSLDLDTKDRDGQTLLFRYPTVWAQQPGYIAPVVRIELGARSDTEPRETSTIGPLVAEAFPHLIVASTVPVRAVAARRTFWEKVLLLHEESHRPTDKRRQPRMSRHYYDVHRLVERGIASAATADMQLFERIVEHRRVFFRYGWMDYETMKKGRLRLIPLPAQEPDWKADYEAMRTEMFYAEPPAFDAVLGTVRRFQDEFNTE